ncbi:Stealth CR1 domain-containing protein [Geobacter sulfurreducens]|uniref:Stealth CR1 domain-containing protein n=1 Tax=Geobacter sulfurreducens TaxID=35554 RepID=UPI002C8FCE11|nr:Stealth CR1 domain-containing protein [Geobacter sulfurreducens]HML78468.1 Stealth CR1 domain-containing protein [Geobacter sulfurreducens]
MKATTDTSDGIDFVVLWVDGNDSEWQEAFDTYASTPDGDKRQCRYRDWGNLRYMFRGFEVFTPWVRKIHFVTWGHLPPWLNVGHKKLNIVTHADFLDAENLPIFNCNPMEVNLHKIRGLSEKFVYFNDDTFILKPVAEDYFFKNGLPRDIFVFNAIFMDTISHIRLNAIQIANRQFRKREVLGKHFFKIFNLRYGLHQIRSVLMLPWPQITGFYDTHQPQPFLKSTFDEVWKFVGQTLEATTRSRFRSRDDINQYLFRYWQLLTGNFSPRSFSDTATIPVHNLSDMDKASLLIKKRNKTMLCINDELNDVSVNMFNDHKSKIIDAFEMILPNKSSFEV